MNPSTLGERIKYYRKRLGLTQEQLAERMGVSAQAVSKWENGLSCPDISILPNLADVFGISMDELLGRAPSAPVHDAEPIEPQPESGKSVLFHLPGKERGSLLFALFVLTVGALLLVDHILALDISFWTLLWTTGLLYLGVSGLVGGFSLFSLVLSLGGLYFLISAFGVLQLSLSWDVILPALLLIWGISLLIDVLFGRKKRRKKAAEPAHHGHKSVCEMSCEDGMLRCEMNFGSRKLPVAVPLLRGGKIESSFGEFTLDFSPCTAVAPDCRLSIENSFGSLRLLIPARFRVELTRNESFGAVQFRGVPADSAEAVILIDAEISFGALEIQYI